MVSVVVVVVMFAVTVQHQGFVVLVVFQQQSWPTAVVSIDDDGILIPTGHSRLEGVGNEKYKHAGDGQVEQNFFGGEHCVLVGGGFGLILGKLVLALVVALLCWLLCVLTLLLVQHCPYIPNW